MLNILSICWAQTWGLFKWAIWMLWEYVPAWSFWRFYLLE